MIKLSGQKKAAIIIVMLGKENASKILKHLNDKQNFLFFYLKYKNKIFKLLF